MARTATVILVNIGLAILLLGSMEAGLRLSGLASGGCTDDFCGDMYLPDRFHERYGWLMPPGHPRGYNAEGFRDTHDSGESHVIVLGDSQTEGSGVDENDIYPFILDTSSRDVAFHNFAIRGYSTAQKLLVYEDMADRYNHSVVILQHLLGNDVNDNHLSERRWRPQFRVVDGSLELVSLPAHPYGHEPVDIPVVRDVQRVLADHSVLYDTLAHAIGMSQWYDDIGPSWNGMRLTERLLERVAERAAEHDAQLIILSIPPEGYVRSDGYTHHEGVPIAAEREMLDRVADRPNVSFVSMRPPLRRAMTLSGEECPLYRDDVHLTYIGHHIVAAGMEDVLVNRTDLPLSDGLEPPERCPADLLHPGP